MKTIEVSYLPGNEQQYNTTNRGLPYPSPTRIVAPSSLAFVRRQDPLASIVAAILPAPILYFQRTVVGTRLDCHAHNCPRYAERVFYRLVSTK